MFLKVHFTWGHRLMEKEESPKGHSRVPSSEMDKGILTEEQNLGLPDRQTNKLTPQPGQGAISISAQQDLCTREILASLR